MAAKVLAQAKELTRETRGDLSDGIHRRREDAQSVRTRLRGRFPGDIAYENVLEGEGPIRKFTLD